MIGKETTGDFRSHLKLPFYCLLVAVIVDLSEAKPNVLYEAGYAHALNKPCIHICSTSTDKLPFDVSHWKTTLYHPGQTHKLAKELAQRLKAILD